MKKKIPASERFWESVYLILILIQCTEIENLLQINFKKLYLKFKDIIIMLGVVFHSFLMKL